MNYINAQAKKPGILIQEIENGFLVFTPPIWENNGKASDMFQELGEDAFLREHPRGKLIQKAKTTYCEDMNQVCNLLKELG